MENLEHIVIVVLASLVVRVLDLFVIPTILILAARAMWHNTPRWISSVLVVTAVAKFLTAIPQLLMHPMVQGGGGGISVQQYSKLAIASAMINWPVAIAFAIAVLAMAKNMRKMTEQNIGQVSS
jgi:hypothetical protein